MRESVFAASGFSLVSLWFQAEKGASAISPLDCLSFANAIQADLPTCNELTITYEIFDQSI